MNASVRVVDYNGKTVYTDNWMKTEKLQIDVRGLSPGIYFIEVQPVEGDSITRKLLIAK